MNLINKILAMLDYEIEKCRDSWEETQCHSFYGALEQTVYIKREIEDLILSETLSEGQLTTDPHQVKEILPS
jgi:hypothetical protein